MAQPLAGVLVSVRIVGRLVHHFDLHFTDTDAGGRMIRNIKVARERTQLLELHLVYHRIGLVRH